MSESLMKPIITIISFIAIFGLIAGALAPVLTASQEQTGSYSHPQRYAYIAGEQYEIWYCDYPTGYEIGEDNVTINDMIKFDTNELVFWENAGGPEGDGDIRIWIVRYDHWGSYWSSPTGPPTSNPNDPFDGFIIHQKVGWLQNKWDCVSFGDVLNTITDNGTNEEGWGDFVVNTGMSLFCTNVTGSGTSLSDALYGNDDYYLNVGWNYFNETLAQGGALDIIIGLLTFSLPDINPVISIILGVPIWACIVFVMFTVITRLIPFIPGG